MRGEQTISLVLAWRLGKPGFVFFEIVGDDKRNIFDEVIITTEKEKYVASSQRMTAHIGLSAEMYKFARNQYIAVTSCCFS